MFNIRRLKERARSFSQELTSSLNHSPHTTTIGECPTCGERTRWAIRPLNGFCRCHRCGTDPLYGKTTPESSRPAQDRPPVR